MTEETTNDEVVETDEEQAQEESDQPQQKQQKRKKREIVGVCTECNSTNTKQYLEKNSFWLAGKQASCQFCGGVVIRAAKGSVDRAIERNRRSIGS